MQDVDKAGQRYWNNRWVRAGNPGFSPETSYLDWTFARVIQRLVPARPDATVLEAGCADSVLLPYVASLGPRVIGVDYSAIGCERSRARMPEARIECCDIFRPPTSLIGSCDAVYSIGLVEHFTDTRGCVAALAAFLKPGGRLLTIIPNMRGAVGTLQRFVARSIFDIHVPLTLEQLAAAHTVKILESGYLLPVGFGVVNPGESLLSRAIVGLAARLSKVGWVIDRRFRLPRSQMLSPYCYALAEVPGSAGSDG